MTDFRQEAGLRAGLLEVNKTNPLDQSGSFWERMWYDRTYRMHKMFPAAVSLDDLKAWLTPSNYKVSLAIRFMWRCYCRNWSVKFAIPSPLQMGGFIDAPKV